MRLPLVVVILLATAAGAAAAQSDDSLRTRIFPLPFLFYQPETKLGGGVGLLTTYRAAPTSRASSANLIGAYTQRRQFTLFAQLEHYTPANRWRIASEVAFSRFPDFFYGVGNATRTADEESYTLQHVRATLDVRRAVSRTLALGVTGWFHDATRREVASGGLLDAGTIPGSQGGRITAVGAVASRDTRDNTFATWHGSWISVATRRAGALPGSDFTYTRTDLDARRFTTRGGHTVGVQLLATTIGGTPPFYDLAALGGQMALRGSYEGRYRDRQRLLVQGEWRFPLRGRVSGVAFAGAGEVMPRWRDLSVGGLHHTVGGGVRFRLSPERVNLRIDYGIGKGTSGLYFALGEAF